MKRRKAEAALRHSENLSVSRRSEVIISLHHRSLCGGIEEIVNGFSLPTAAFFSRERVVSFRDRSNGDIRLRFKPSQASFIDEAFSPPLQPGAKI